MSAHWGVPDPAAIRGTQEQVQKAFREAFFLIDRRISLFLSLPLATLKKEIDSIGRY
jgi:arsenate reductase